MTQTPSLATLSGLLMASLVAVDAAPARADTWVWPGPSTCRKQWNHGSTEKPAIALRRDSGVGAYIVAGIPFAMARDGNRILVTNHLKQRVLFDPDFLAGHESAQIAPLPKDPWGLEYRANGGTWLAFAFVYRYYTTFSMESVSTTEARPAIRFHQVYRLLRAAFPWFARPFENRVEVDDCLWMPAPQNN